MSSCLNVNPSVNTLKTNYSENATTIQSTVNIPISENSADTPLTNQSTVNTNSTIDNSQNNRSCSR